MATEASLAWYFDRKNVRTTFQVRKVLSIKDILALVLVQNGIRKLDHLFRFFGTFVASKSHFFERRTSSHVGWVVIIRWRLRAPCLQVLSSKMHK